MKRIAVAGALVVVLAVAGSVVLHGSETNVAARSELTFEIYKDAKREFRWRLKAGNGKVIGMSDEGHARKEDCRHAVTLIQEGAAKAKVEEVPATD